ncbi:terminase small subunit [Pseudoramibacter alactolyticus]|uniref:terminase small subunit n=1 Tax=Pseudoramibacter alactolyticus TaxID=113287 RepID=UPI0028EE5F6E|nr:terminase small subunit [Pseudoramibacter alactolyticus]
MKLTLKQQRFADEYIISGNATQAAIKAGYSKRTANRMAAENMTKPVIKAYISERLAQLESAKIAKQDEVLRYLTGVMRAESVSETVVVEGVGKGFSKARVMDKHPEEQERLKAAELLGKRYGLFRDRVEADVDMDLNINIDYGPDD